MSFMGIIANASRIPSIRIYLWHNEEKVLFPENENNACKTYSQDLIHEQALKFIRDHKEQPFFAMLTYTLPHAELNLPHDSVYKMYENSFEETPYIGKFDKVYGGYNTSEKPWPPLPPWSPGWINTWGM